jgi:Na+:H+ antiporter, NhaC family
MLSRAVEDSGTVTSPLVPWNSCGAYMAGVLGIATFSYLPYCFFNIASPIISLLYGFTGFRIERVPPSGEPTAMVVPASTLGVQPGEGGSA